MKRFKRMMLGSLAALPLIASGQAEAATATLSDAGTLKDGTPVSAIVLSNGKGVAARVLTYGATLQSLVLPGRDGTPADVVLGHDTVAEYERTQSYFGVTVGRYANRIAGARFTLDGKTYVLPANNGPNSLHGGGNGFDRHNWAVKQISSGEVAAVSLGLHSPDGDAGYPGNLDVTVTYAMDAAGALSITFEARTDRPTIINMTNHALYDLSGGQDPAGILGHRLTVPASRYTPVGNTLIPTGELRSVEGTVFDFRQGRVVSDGLRDGRDPQILVGRGYDHNFVIDAGLTREAKLVARLEHDGSGRVLEMLSTEPGVQVYTGNFLDGTLPGKQGRLYRMGDGIALEPQKYPDSPNQPSFPSARLDPGATYRHVIILKPGISAARGH